MTFVPMKALLIVLLLIKMQPMNDIKTNAESCFDLSGYLIMYDLTLSQLFNGSIFKLNEYYFIKKTVCSTNWSCRRRAKSATDKTLWGKSETSTDEIMLDDFYYSSSSYDKVDIKTRLRSYLNTIWAVC